MCRKTQIAMFCLLFGSLALGCSDDDEQETGTNLGTGSEDAGIDGGGTSGDRDAGDGATTRLDAAGGDAARDGGDDPTPDAGGSDAGAGADASAGDAGAADAGSDAGPALTFSQLYTAIFQPRCRSCHRNTVDPSGPPAGGLDLTTSAVAYAELVTAPDAQGVCAGNNRKRVIPGNPDDSLLIQKLEGTQDCGDRMPRNAAALSQAQIGQVRAWIAAGAQSN